MAHESLHDSAMSLFRHVACIHRLNSKGKNTNLGYRNILYIGISKLVASHFCLLAVLKMPAVSWYIIYTIAGVLIKPLTINHGEGWESVCCSNCCLSAPTHKHLFHPTFQTLVSLFTLFMRQQDVWLNHEYFILKFKSRTQSFDK